MFYISTLTSLENPLPFIPTKRYFTIGEVSSLCGVKPHVLRYWEQEFTQLRPMKRRGNRRYYQHHEVLMILKIRDLLYDQGFTISGARNKLLEVADTDTDTNTDSDNSNKHSTVNVAREGVHVVNDLSAGSISISDSTDVEVPPFDLEAQNTELPTDLLALQSLQLVRLELFEIRDLLNVNP